MCYISVFIRVEAYPGRHIFCYANYLRRYVMQTPCHDPNTRNLLTTRRNKASFVRVQFELQFEKLNAEVFAESSQFAAEAFSAFRTVTALTLEDMICARYATLLQGHVDKAFKKARFTTLVFALSDSIALLCMALTFW